MYKNREKWIVRKWIKGKSKQYGSFNTLEEAIHYRNYLERNNWVEPELTKEKLNRLQKKYYVRVQRDSTHRYFRIKHIKGKIIGRTYDLCEALYFRDLYSEAHLNDIPNIYECDLRKDNPYLQNGLKYPIPDRLKLTEKPSKRGLGKISKKSISSYSVHIGKKHICSCRTYEQAWYVRREMVKCDWNVDELTRILDEYPIFYTDLLHFYIYISLEKATGSWLLTIPKNKSDDGNLQHIRYSKLEDALFERDFLMKYGWNYDLLVELIDDTDNKYYNMELPPYPERKIRNIRPRENHDEDLLKLAEVVKENPNILVKDWAKSINITDATLRIWLKQYNTNTSEFRKIVLEGKNPLDYFQQEKLIYQPDLSKSLPANYSGYVHYKPERKSKYIVSKNDIYYGAYKTREIADAVVKELIKVDWNKDCLDSIKKKLNIRNWTNEEMYIYRNRKNSGTWRIRKKLKGKNVNFGGYETLELAVIVRDILINNDFKCEDLEELKQFGEYVLYNKRLYYSNMFGGGHVLNVE